MKTIKLLLISLLFGGSVYGQAPIGAPPVNAANVSLTARSAWYKGGNDNNGAAPNNNIFGTAAGFNSTIWHQTNGFNRMVMYNGTDGNNAGRIGIGNNLRNGFTLVL